MMRALFVAWRSGDSTNGAWGPVGRLEYDGRLYRFRYTRGATMLPGFAGFPQMDDLERVYESTELFPLFANRLLSKNRFEYESYLRWSGFEPGNSPDPIAVLGVTEGTRQTDAVEVFPVPELCEDGRYLNRFFLHGMRWMHAETLKRVAHLRPHERLLPMPDPCNDFDPHAVAVRTDSERALIGYVPRYLARDIQSILQNCDPEWIDLRVVHVNPDAPLQHRLLCQLHACWPPSLRPYAGEQFQPIEGVERPPENQTGMMRRFANVLLGK